MTIAKCPTISLALLAVLAVLPAMAQTVGVQPASALQLDSVRDTALANVVANGAMIKEGHVKATWYRVMSVAVGARIEEDAEDSGPAVSWVYVVIGDMGEGSAPAVYRLGPMLVPKVESVEARGDGVIMKFSYIEASKRRTAWVTATSKGVTVSAKRPTP